MNIYVQIIRCAMSDSRVRFLEFPGKSAIPPQLVISIEKLSVHNIECDFPTIVPGQEWLYLPLFTLASFLVPRLNTPLVLAPISTNPPSTLPFPDAPSVPAPPPPLPINLPRCPFPVFCHPPRLQSHHRRFLTRILSLLSGVSC